MYPNKLYFSLHVLLVNPVKPVVRPLNKEAPLRAPEKKHLRVMGPEPMNPKQSALADTLSKEVFGLFGALSALAGDNSQLAHLQSGLVESLVMSKAPSTFNKYQPVVSKWEQFAVK